MENHVTGVQNQENIGDQAYKMQSSETAADVSSEAAPSEASNAAVASVIEGGESTMDGSGVTEQQFEGNNSTMGVDNTAHLEDPAAVTEEDRLWNIVKANPTDFSAWTSLIQEVDKLGDKPVLVDRIRRVYDTFLAEFPLCYGYWKKYADHEGRLGCHETIISVYERAVQGVTYSVDIWMHYCSYLISRQEDPDEIRRLFERGLAYVGTDYLSHILWDKYLEFELSLNELSRVSQIYTRIIQIPIQQLDRYYHSYKQFIPLHALSDLQSKEERSASAAAAAGAIPDTSALPAESEGPNVPKAEEWSEENEIAKFIFVRDEMYKAAKEQDARIVEYESAIRRPYFHVKPLDDAQLANWHRYLDFIERVGDLAKVIKLYERCLIACANYPEYWIRYVQHMDSQGSMEYAVDALTRATQIFVKRRPEVHLFAARFKEEHGDVEAARFEYGIINSSLSPGLLESIVKTANFEHRQGNTEGACACYSAAIEYEKSKEESRTLPFLFIQYARFLDQVALKTDKAREVYSDALALLPLSRILWEALIHFEAYRSGPKEIGRLESFIEEATAAPKPDVPGLNVIDREEIWSIYLEFLDLFGEFQTLRKAEARHRQLFPLRKGLESRKRPSDGSGSDRAKLLKVHGSASNVSPAPAAAAGYANGQAQWGAGYGQPGYAQQPQAWQQSPAQQTQVQSQQWPQAYSAPQAGYGGYANYGAYVPPQPPVAAPPQQQPTAYAGYSQGYTPQAFSQQPGGGYAQQPAYSQPQVPAQQGYYTGYY